MSTSKRIWAIVPAAGTGQRMQSQIPKQYLALSGKTVIEHTLSKLNQIQHIEGIIVTIAKNDTHFGELSCIPKKTIVIEGGNQRCDSVLNALHHLKDRGFDDDWALVHDAARPCVRTKNIQNLIQQVLAEEKGGILACPAVDTLKQVSSGAILKTIDRTEIWHAQTPQMFKINDLLDALTSSITAKRNITDEASAMEQFGISPIVVADSRDNIKITQPEDLPLAEFITRNQALAK